MSDMLESTDMPAEIDFSQNVPNPYVGRVRCRVTINIDAENIDYFKAEVARTSTPYQTIINMFLTECLEQGMRLTFA